MPEQVVNYDVSSDEDDMRYKKKEDIFKGEGLSPKQNGNSNRVYCLYYQNIT